MDTNKKDQITYPSTTAVSTTTRDWTMNTGLGPEETTQPGLLEKTCRAFSSFPWFPVHSPVDEKRFISLSVDLPR